MKELDAFKRLCDSESGRAILKAVGIGTLYYVFHKLGVEVEPKRSVNISLGGKNHDRYGDFVRFTSNSEDDTYILAIKDLESDAVNSFFDSTKKEHAEKICDLVSNVTIPSDHLKSEAIKSLRNIKSQCVYESTRESITNYIMEVLEN